jgi:hypothetical protein
MKFENFNFLIYFHCFLDKKKPILLKINSRFDYLNHYIEYIFSKFIIGVRYYYDFSNQANHYVI